MGSGGSKTARTMVCVRLLRLPCQNAEQHLFFICRVQQFCAISRTAADRFLAAKHMVFAGVVPQHTNHGVESAFGRRRRELGDPVAGHMASEWEAPEAHGQFYDDMDVADSFSRFPGTIGDCGFGVSNEACAQHGTAQKAIIWGEAGVSGGHRAPQIWAIPNRGPCFCSSLAQVRSAPRPPCAKAVKNVASSYSLRGPPVSAGPCPGRLSQRRRSPESQ